MTCPYPHDDAAYLLGALDPEERQRYEEHLDTCPFCSSSVRDLAGVPGLLARLTPEQVASTEAPIEAPPAALLAGLLRSVRRSRRLSRLRVGLVTGVVAAGLAVLGAFGFQSLTTASAPVAQEVMLEPMGDQPVHGHADLMDHPWGTEISMDCEYEGSWAASGATYTLVVNDLDGVGHTVSTWQVIPNASVPVRATTMLTRDQLSALEVRTDQGEVVLYAEL